MSPLKDLREKYRAKNLRQAVNAAIRAELAGGPETLDALELFHKIMRRQGEWQDDRRTPTVAKLAYDRLCGIANSMEQAIRKRYGMPPLF